jgi:hypothetical protein
MLGIAKMNFARAMDVLTNHRVRKLVTVDAAMKNGVISR